MRTVGKIQPPAPVPEAPRGSAGNAERFLADNPIIMFAWTPDLSVDVKEIDDQHKIFIATMAEMEKAAAEHQAKQILGSILLKLFGYAHYHFATEEKYFSLFLYSGAEPHRRVHQEFVSKVLEFRQRFEVKGEDVSAEVGPFMYDWLVNHIKSMDRQYIGNFHEHGLK